MSEATQHILIKKYANRRLYDTAHSQYVNLKQIGELVKEGNTVEVIDTATSEDLTKIILTQIILEEERDQRNLLPADFLHRLIQYGESAYEEFVEQFVRTGLATYRSAQKQMETAFRGWLNPWFKVSNPQEEIESLKARLAELETRLAEEADETERTD